MSNDNIVCFIREMMLKAFERFNLAKKGKPSAGYGTAEGKIRGKGREADWQ